LSPKNSRIIALFRSNVRGKTEPVKGDQHDGFVGNWLEEQFGISKNNRNAPDIDGYELKKDSKDRISFGDWSADYYIFKGIKPKCTRLEFLQSFGKYNVKRDYYSWSGEYVPKYGQWNKAGQRLHIDKDGNIFAIYNWLKDHRENKEQVVQSHFRNGNLVLACWKAASLRTKVERKFNVNGWFTCLTDDSGKYYEICFGDAFSFEDFLGFVRDKKAIFDSGMYSTNIKPYSSWRAKREFWHSRIVQRVK